MTITATHVESSNINRVGYEGTTLYLGFNSGVCYSYANVPYWTYLNLLKAESIGKYFYANVRGKYTYTQLAADPFDSPARLPKSVV